MCGIAGIFDPTHRLDPERTRRAARAQGDSLAHRGPDGDGFFDDPTLGVNLAHRRLAVIDLTSTGNQPIASPGGRYITVYNGEIYNYREIAQALAQEGVMFDARADTRVLLAAIETWGLEQALARTIGMFALVLVDRQSNEVHLIRDRFGVKPLSFGRINGAYFFGSELCAIEAGAKALDLTMPPLEPKSLGYYAAFGHVAEGTTIYQGIEKVPPGGIVTLHADGSTSSRPYWSYEALRQAARAPQGSDQQIFDQLEALLSDAVGLRLVADVPVGIFLSGGIDSSLIAALAHRQSRTPGGRVPHSFTVGFDDLGLNEAPKAREVAYHIGIPHHEIMVDAAAALALVPTLAKVFDEPFADASAIPTYLIAQKAREHVTVALSGDGGDEGFGGYARHIFAAMLDERLSAVPRPLQALGGAALDLFSADAIDNLLGAIKGQTQSAFIRRLTGGRVKGLARYLSSGQSGDLYDRLRRQWPDISDMLQAPIEPEMTQLPKAARLDSSMMAADMVGYLPADVLVKVDRATMAHGLEAREPLLDHNLLAFAAGLPAHLRIKGGKGKRALAAVLHRHVPEALVDRPKQGFSVPMDQWLRGPLRAWADEMLNDPSLATSGLFNVPRLREIFAAHQSGRIDRQHQLWNALMLISWLKARRLI